MGYYINLDHRLETLPKKVASPFRQLLQYEHLTEEALIDILDAAELSDQQSKALGFAIGYLHLRSKGIPIHDVIRMAKAQKRRINLAWSPNRWKSEHDRLSRAEALERLTKENITYDLSKYETFLPDKFDGYLIRSSRRLGMEGLRQRHCVASFHHHIQSGRCAIASIIADGKRWTVELKLTNDAENPIHITQIKTKFNNLPTPDTKKHIHDMLGIQIPSTPPHGSARRNHTYMDTLRRLLPILRQHGVNEVIVRFDGSGDSGAIDEIAHLPFESSDVSQCSVSYMKSRSYFEDGAWVHRVEEGEATVDEAIDALTYDYLEQTGVDWCNNDGGFGELHINVAEETVTLEVNTRFTEYDTAYSDELGIQ